MSNSWIMEYVNSTNGHVQAGELILIPEDERGSTGYTISDGSVPASTGTWALADLSSLVPPGTTAVYGSIMLFNNAADETAIMFTRGDGETSTTDVQVRSWGIYADEPAGSSYIHLGAPGLIYAPGGKFYYAYQAGNEITLFRFILWGYYTK